MTLASEGHGLALALFAALAASCSGSAGPPPVAAQREGPAEAILSIGKVWEARQDETGFRTSPSPIATFQSQALSRITLVAGAPNAHESVQYEERFTLQDGRVAHCKARLDASISVAYGLKAGEPAIEVSWGSARLPRDCDLKSFPVPVLERAAGRSRFVLRSDQLVPIEPPSEKRSFIPVD